jgi:hypothetical protein
MSAAAPPPPRPTSKSAAKPVEIPDRILIVLQLPHAVAGTRTRHKCGKLARRARMS